MAKLRKLFWFQSFCTTFAPQKNKQTLHTDMITREEILERATPLFVRDGIKSVRMDDVAHELGISKRTLYEVFSDRKELIKECIEYYCISCDNASKESFTEANNIFDEVWKLLIGTMEFRKNTFQLFQQVSRHYPQMGQELFHSHHEGLKVRLEQMIQRGKEQGFVLEWIDNDYFSRAITNYLYGLNIIENHTHLTGTKTDENSFPIAVVVFLRGIATNEGRNYIDTHLLQVAK